ncbi:MAG: GatB/YqeY domain-containing protein [Nannocystaceae bacterium]
MSIQEEINEALKQARRDRDADTKRVITMLKAKLTNELKSAPDVEENDALWLKVLAAYAKELKKALASFEGLGDRAAEAKAESTFELDFCERFLPKKLDEAATAALVQKIAEAEGITEKKDMGRLMGAIMRAHKDEVDGDLVRKAAQAVLS